jgi:hypothetical protein
MSSSRSSAWAVALVTVLGAAAGCRVDAQKCDQACRNAASLLYWKTADREISAAPADQRDALRKQKLGEFAKKVEEGIDGCVLRCQSARNADDASCLIEAKTAEQVQACSR